MISIRTFFAKLNLKADYKIGLIDSKHILIELHVEEDYHRIWMRTQWNIFQFPLLISKWHVDFTPENESPMTPVWVSLPLLPPHLFKKEALISIANLIGNPMKIDTSTANLARPSKARVCVEIDVTKTLPKRGWIGQGENGFWQEFAYEFIPQYCHICHQLGHGDNNCMRNENTAQNKAYENKNNNIAQNKARDNNIAQNKAKENKDNKGKRHEIKEGKKVYVPVDKEGSKENLTTENLEVHNVPSSSFCKNQNETVNEDEQIQEKLEEEDKGKDQKIGEEKDKPVILDVEGSMSSIKEVEQAVVNEEGSKDIAHIKEGEPVSHIKVSKADINSSEDNDNNEDISTPKSLQNNSAEMLTPKSTQDNTDDIDREISEINYLCSQKMSLSDNEGNNNNNSDLQGEDGKGGWQGKHKKSKKQILQSEAQRNTRARAKIDAIKQSNV